MTFTKRKRSFATILIILIFVILGLIGCSSKDTVADYSFHDLTISLDGNYSMMTRDELYMKDSEALSPLDLSKDSAYDYLLEDEMFIRLDAGAVTGVYCLSMDYDVSSVFDYASFIKDEEAQYVSQGEYFIIEDATVNDNPASKIVWSEFTGISYVYTVSTAFALNGKIYVFRTKTLDDKSGEMILDYYDTILKGVSFEGYADDVDTFKNVIRWDEAAKHVGEVVTVKGEMVSGGLYEDEPGSPIYIDLGRPYPEDGRFTIVIWEEHRSQFDLSELPVEGDIVYVTGKIEKYKSIYQIEAAEGSQIKVE